MSVIVDTTKAEIEMAIKYARVGANNCMIGHTWEIEELVRCGECSHSEVCKMDDGDVRYCHIFEMQTEDDYYCADGESLEEDDLRTSANHDGERREE